METFAKHTQVSFTEQYGKNPQRGCQEQFFYPVWELFLYACREFPSKILSVYLVTSTDTKFID